MCACMLRENFLDYQPLGLLRLPAPRWAIVPRWAAVHQRRTLNRPRWARSPSLLLLSPHFSSAWGMPTRTGEERDGSQRTREEGAERPGRALAPMTASPGFPGSAHRSYEAPWQGRCGRPACSRSAVFVFQVCVSGSRISGTCV